MSVFRFLGFSVFLLLGACGAVDQGDDSELTTGSDEGITLQPSSTEESMRREGDEPNCSWCPNDLVYRCCVNGPDGTVCQPATCR